eukprot:CCRYP_020398-RB/>CCRYP_020398-RB protein AED:0.03 eAED:0.03 QI:794/1/1/1/0/0.5/2/130/858
MLSQVNDNLVDESKNKLKLALLGHVNPTPLSHADLNSRLLTQDTLTIQESEEGIGYEVFGTNNTDAIESRQLYDKNKGGFFSSLSKSEPITETGRAYGFVVDIDIELKLNDGGDTTANTALLGGYVLESSPLVYPVAMTQSRRDPDQIYVVSMHADQGSEGVLNPEYTATIQMESDASLRMRPDVTLGGAGGNGADMVGGVPKYGDAFYVSEFRAIIGWLFFRNDGRHFHALSFFSTYLLEVQQLSITPYQKLMGVEPTETEKIKTTMMSGWGFGFKLNDAKDVRPSCVEFVKGKTPDDDLILLAGTTRKEGAKGYSDLDGFVTKLIPPPPSPVPDYTTGTTVDSASSMQTEAKNPTKRIDSTTGRDETVTAICLPPPNPKTGVITHAFIVGSIANSESESNPSGKDPSLAYILMMKLEDMSTIWKQRIPSIHPDGIGGDVLGEGCAVSPDGKVVYLAGTIDGGSVLHTGLPNNLSDPSDPSSPPIKPAGGVSDVFVVAYDVVFGNVMWGKQLGTVYDDKLARGGGITVDNDGNAIIMGSTRGPLQRYRPNESNGTLQALQRLASDIFVMSLSRTNGKFINAPYTGSPITSGMSASTSSTASMGSAAGGLSSGAIAGISIASILFACFFGVCLCRQVRRKKDVKASERMWDRDYSDDYSFDLPGSGYRGSFLGGRKGGGKGSVNGLRIVRGGMRGDAWDDGEDRISKSASWMKNNDDISRFSPSNMFKSERNNAINHNASYASRKSDENSDFLASLRDEANITMSKMFNESDTKDPRLDDGASIKSLLSHYREVRKGKLFVSEESTNQVKDGSSESDERRRTFAPTHRHPLHARTMRLEEYPLGRIRQMVSLSSPLYD